jgi:hypothetical protein
MHESRDGSLPSGAPNGACPCVAILLWLQGYLDEPQGVACLLHREASGRNLGRQRCSLIYGLSLLP